jgi:hypothetical protein
MQHPVDPAQHFFRDVGLPKDVGFFWFSPA